MISARLLLDSTAQAIYGIDPQGICTFCNAACVRILGYDNADQIVGRNMHDLIYPSFSDDTTIAAEECELLKDMDQQYHCANKMFCRVDGSSFPVEYWSYPIIQDDQNLGQVVSFVDITKRKQMDETLRLQAQRAEALLELPRFADEYDEKSFMQRAQEMAEDLTSSKIAFIHFINDGGQEIELTTWSRRTLEHYCTAAYDSHYPVSKAGIWADALREGKPVIFNDYPNYSHKKGLPDGHSMLQRLISVPVIENGQVVMLAGVGNKDTDYSDCDSESVQLIASAIWQIVKKIRMAKASQEAMERIERLARHVPGALYQFQLRPDGSFRFPYASQGIQNIYGVLPEQVIDDAKAAFRAIHPEDLARVNVSIQESARTLNPWTDQYRVNLPEGQTIWVEGESTPEAQSDGSILWHGYLRDITESKQAQLALEQKNQEMEQFVYSVSHDLKSPLVTVRTFAGMLREDLPGGDQQQTNNDLNYIDKAADRMQQLLDALLRYSRIGTVDAPAQTLSAGQSVQNCLGSLAGILQQQIQVSTAKLPQQLHGDPLHFGQIWQNLIENAVKYMGGQALPQIEIGATQQEQEVVFYVRDNGMGILPEHKESIFNLFSQLDQSSDGSGLGLALVKKIVSIYQGRIWVESAGKDQGSCFMFTLPGALKRNEMTE